MADIVHEIKGSKLKNVGHGYSMDISKGSDGNSKEQVSQGLEGYERDAEVAGFSMGWFGNLESKLGAKGGKGKLSKGAGGKGKKADRLAFKRETKKGQWTGLNRPSKDLMEVGQGGKDGPKRKSIETVCQRGLSTEKDKRQKVEEETKKLSVLFATPLRSAEVAKQPRQDQ